MESNSHSSETVKSIRSAMLSNYRREGDSTDSGASAVSLNRVHEEDKQSNQMQGTEGRNGVHETEERSDQMQAVEGRNRAPDHDTTPSSNHSDGTGYYVTDDLVSATVTIQRLDGTKSFVDLTGDAATDLRRLKERAGDNLPCPWAVYYANHGMECHPTSYLLAPEDDSTMKVIQRWARSGSVTLVRSSTNIKGLKVSVTVNDETSFVKLDPTSAERSLEMLKLKLSDKDRKDCKGRFKTSVGGMEISFSIDDSDTMEAVLERATGLTHLEYISGKSNTRKRGPRESEIRGKITKARLSTGASVYVNGDQYDRLNADTEGKRKFLNNRRFLDMLVNTSGSVNLLKPHEVICHLCGTILTLQCLGSLSDYKKHLSRHKGSASTSDSACRLLARWEELESGDPDKLTTPVPDNLTIKYKHDAMISEAALERRLSNPRYDVLAVHGQTNIHSFFNK